MFLDAKSLPNGSSIETDICIIGGGAAGITIAPEFVDWYPDVVLLESGGEVYSQETQNLYIGKNIGRNYYELDACRLRYFGGARPTTGEGGVEG